MNDVSFFTPDDIPSEVLAYAGTVKQLDVGQSGKVGLLKLVLVKSDDRTLIKEQVAEAPLHLSKALHYEQDFPAIAYLYLASTSGGILQGDRYRTDISMKEDSIAHITTQGATRVYSMECNSATQMINLTLERNSYLEFIPDQIIPYKNSRYYQKVNLNVDESATLVYSEVITPGRIAMEEEFAYDICYLRTAAKNQKEKLLFSDVAKIEPKKQNSNSFGILGQNKIVGTMYIVSERYPEVESEISSLFEKQSISIGSSILPHDCGIMIRILGNNMDEIKEVIFQITKITRKIVIDAPFSSVRKS